MDLWCTVYLVPAPEELQWQQLSHINHSSGCHRIVLQCARRREYARAGAADWMLPEVRPHGMNLRSEELPLPTDRGRKRGGKVVNSTLCTPFPLVLRKTP